MKRLFNDKSSGFSLVESLIALAIGGVVTMYAGNMIKATLDSNKIAKRLNILSELETRVQRAFLDAKSFAKTKGSNAKLQACIDVDKKTCELNNTDVDLWLVKKDGREENLTGSYDAALKSCSTGCALELKTKMNAGCETGPSCDAAAVISLSYEVLVNKQVVKRGAFSRQNVALEKSDTNIGCGLDKDTNIPQYVNAVDSGTLTCASLPGITRQLDGVTPGDCKRGSEVLGGFDSEGKIICVPIVFSPAQGEEKK